MLTLQNTQIVYNRQIFSILLSMDKEIEIKKIRKEIKEISKQCEILNENIKAVLRLVENESKEKTYSFFGFEIKKKTVCCSSLLLYGEVRGSFV